MHNNIALK